MIQIAGHLGADPETRFTSGGQKVTTLRVAARIRRSGKDETIWWRVTLWGDQFDKMLPHLKKGSPIIVYGELAKPEIYNDREGRPQVSMNLTAFSLQFSPFGRQDREDSPAANPMAAAASAAAAAPTMPKQPEMPSYSTPEQSGSSSSFDDEVPF